MMDELSNLLTLCYKSIIKSCCSAMQTQMQQFLNVISNVQNTPPEHANDALAHIRKLYTDMPDQQAYSFALFRAADHIMKLKSFNEQIQWLVEQCIFDVICHAVEGEFRVGTQALRCIFDASSDYYKHNNLDASLKFPLGMIRKLEWYEPEVGDTVDVVKPYITSTSFCCWTRGVLLSKENKKYTVKFENTETPVTNVALPWFDVAGSRTPDHDWRLSLNVGDHIDAYNKFWYPSTVVQSGVENGAKRVRVTFRRFNQNGTKVDSEGNHYDGLGINEDDWIDIFSCRIQRPNKMSRELCYYSHNCEQILIDDTYDLLFEKEYNEKPFWGIMRTNFTRSLSYLHFMNFFCDLKGHEVFIQKVRGKDINIDNFTNMLLIFGNLSHLVPRMGLALYLPTVLEVALDYVKENNKLFNPYRLDCFSFFFENTAKRLYSLSRKHVILNNLRKFLSLQYLKLNLEKQMIGLRFLNELIRPLRPYQDDAQKKELESFLIDNQIFYKIIQSNVHEQILSRSVDLLRFMMATNIIGWNQIQYIWNIIPHSDLRGRTTIEKLIGDISKDFSLQYTSRIIDKLIAVKETEITIDKLNLLRTLKDKPLIMQVKVKILNYLWECLTVKSINIKQTIEQEIENVFRGFISTIKQSSLKLQVLKAILRRLKEINTVRNEMHLFKQFLLTYPSKLEDGAIEIEGDVPQTITQIIIYLKNESIYGCLLRLLGSVKTKEKIESILEFTCFLFSKDKDDISSTVKSIYELLGPSDQFLLWAKNLTSRALKFFIELYEDTSNMQKFEKISANGLQAIKTILLDINVHEGNIKILKKRKAAMIGPALPPLSNLPNTVSTSTSEYPPKSSTEIQTQNAASEKVQKQKNEKDQTLTFVYVLKSPFECKGLAFLLQLLQYIKNNRVYCDIIKLIIQFIVNLEDRIVHKTQIFREEFLSRIFKEMAEIASKNELNDAIKLKLEIYVNLIEELFCETEKEGLGSIRPHFSTVDGEVICLKIENCISGNEISKKQPYQIEVNENITLWDLKLSLAEYYKQSPLKLDIVKYVNPLEDTVNSKSMQQLHFFNEEAIKVQAKSPKEIPRHDLLTPENESLSERFNQIVERWFNGYQNEQGYLSLTELVKLATEQWKGTIFREQKRLLEIISKYDVAKKGGLYLDEFKAFFIKKSVENNVAIWRMINLSGYRNNLKHKDDLEIQFDEGVFPRRILSNPVVYDTIFMILSSDKFQPIHLNFYKLLTMLETDHTLSNIVKSNIREFLQNEKCIYRLSYGLESLINELKHNLHLYGEFYQHNGHVEIASKLQNYFKDQTTSIYALDVLSKTVVIPNLLKILNFYVYPLISSNIFVRLIKKTKINHYDLEELMKKVEKQQNYANEELEKREVLLSKNKPFDLSQIFALAQKILQNEIVNFKTDYLIKATFQISRLFGSLALVQPSFRPESILNGVKCESMNLRRICQSTIFFYLLGDKTAQFDLLDRMIAEMPKQIKLSSSNHYFNLVSTVLERSIELTKDNPECDAYFKNLALRVIDIVWTTPNELRGHNNVNRLLFGLFQVFLQILLRKPKICRELQYLKEELMSKCLFFYDSQQKIKQLRISPQLLLASVQPELFPDYVKCKADETRKIVMEIVYQLYKESEGDHSGFFDTFILPVLRELPENTKKTSSKYLSVGLNNLGSTCYMNAMLQVLNSIEPLRNAIMMANVESPLIRQLKSLFSYLFFSERLDYIPKQLLASFVPPINPGIQQDTTEFLNFLFDQTEESLKNSPYKSLLQQIFQGNQVAQMICHTCGAKRQREEQFFTYSVQIEGKYDLHSALEGMHSGELISDCLCESCGNRSDTTKRNVLNVVPNIFFVHLKRIVFNYDLFVNTKIHTRLNFPDELNFEPYTKQGLELRQSLGVEYMKQLKDNEEELKKFEVLALHGKEKKYYQLKLKAIIIHSGTPDVGHYYTIVKRDSNWFKYDDSRVTLFSSMSFDEECYGGTSVADEWGDPRSTSSKNAYVLVYQKEHKDDIVVEGTLDDQTVVKKAVPYSEFKTFNTEEWYKQVWLDNHSLMIEQHLTSENFTKDFLGFVEKMLELTPSNSTIEIISQIFYKISALSGEVGNLLAIFTKNTFLITKDILYKYVLADGKKTFNLLFHYQQKVREFASEYIHQVLMASYTDGDNEVKGEVFKFIHEYLQMLNGDAAKNWMRIDGYFRLFERLVQASVNYPELYQYFVSADLIAYFIDFILQKSSPLNYIQKKYSLGTKSNPLSFNSGLNIIFFLFKKSYGVNGNNYEIPEVPQHLLFHLTDNAIACLTSMAFYQKLLKESQNREAVSQLIQRMCIMNPDFSLAVARVLLKCFNQNTEIMDELDTIMLAITRVLTIKDAFWQLRAEAILGTSSPFIYQSNLISSIEEEKYTYPSTLQNAFPLESLLSYAHINRTRIPLTVINMVKTILESCSASQQAMQYLLKQPSPSYIHLRYVDWLRPYVNEAINLLKLGDKKLEEVLEKISICHAYLDDLDKVKKEMSAIVVGQVCEKVLVKSLTDEFGRVEVNIYNVPVHGIFSLPNGNSNAAFEKYLTNGRLETQVTTDSNILRYFKQNNKPLAIKPKSVEQDEDKQLTSLFDENPYPVLPAHTPMDIETKQKPQPVPQPKVKKQQLPVAPQIAEQPIELKDIQLQGARIYPDYLRCLEIVNKLEANQLIVISLDQSKSNADSNSTLPLNLRVLASKSKEEFWYTKTDPSSDWNEIDNLRITASHYTQPQKRILTRTYINPFSQQQFEQYNNREMEPERPNGPSKQQAASDDPNHFPQDFSEAEMNCPSCTFLNAISNSTCEVCGDALHSN